MALWATAELTIMALINECAAEGCKEMAVGHKGKAYCPDHEHLKPWDVIIENQSQDECDLCQVMPTRIEECPRDDIAGSYAQMGYDLWCPACGRFWLGDPDEVAMADRLASQEDAEITG